MQIGSVTVRSRVLQAPLSGVTDRTFRRLVRRFAPESMTYTEMVNARELCHLRQLDKILDVDPDEQLLSVQLFDSRPDFIGAAARMAVEHGALTVDINMGCPVNKITRKGGGSSLLRQPDLAARLVDAAVAAVNVPVTVKTRLGWSDDEIEIVEFARRLETAGAQMLTVHARTRSQGYTGAARWEWLARVKASISIPLIANGDIVSVATAARCLEQTGADGVMCSRGTLGNPFLVGDIDRWLRFGEREPIRSPQEYLVLAKEHLIGLQSAKGDRGVRQARKHMAWYARNFCEAAKLRELLAQLESVEDGLRLLDASIEHLDQ
ncbi:tRNA dihydrouridine synthase DusB [Rubidibacter lacunae]|nr:tRNA dihydrouridine synthase DusB [Rubidibacter lacunae]